MAKIVTITNPLTGQPAQVDQLDHTAQQIDDGLNIARGVSNPNLLDNWYFGNPVDQRGGYVVPPGTFAVQLDTTETITIHTDTYYPVKSIGGGDMPVFTYNGKDYAGNAGSYVRGYTGAVYGIDRWKIQSGTIVLNDNYISLIAPSSSEYAMLRQWHKANDLVGKKATFSVLTDNGLRSTTLTIGTSKYVTFDDCVLYHTTSSGSILYEIRSIIGTTVNLIAAKLELGDQQTLAHQDENGNWQLNALPNYADTLSRCQEYGFPQHITYAYGYCVNDTLAYVCIACPASLRKIPVLTVNNPGALNFASQQISVQSLAVARIENSLLYIAVSASGLTPNAVCVLHDADIYIAADL